MTISQERVMELFTYHEDGTLTWRVKLATHTSLSKPAGSPDKQGSLHVGVDKKRYKVHRLVFLYHRGYLPENEVDHIDRDILNNRIENLREISKSCNLRNSKVYVNNKTGVKGVLRKRGANVFITSIFCNGKNNHLYYGEDFTEAVAHRLAAEQSLNWEGCDSNSPAYKYIKELL